MGKTKTIFGHSTQCIQLLVLVYVRRFGSSKLTTGSYCVEDGSDASMFEALEEMKSEGGSE